MKYDTIAYLQEDETEDQRKERLMGKSKEELVEALIYNHEFMVAEAHEHCEIVRKQREAHDYDLQRLHRYEADAGRSRNRFGL